MASPTGPQRQATVVSRRSADSDDEGSPEDASEVTKLFHERLQAFKHVCGYLEEYIEATEHMHATDAKECERMLKAVNSPLKEGDQFERNLGGIAEMFDHIRTNTQNLSNTHIETAKTLKSSVLPVFKRLHDEIKAKQKELNKGAGKASKAVEKARATTQRHTELLGQHSASSTVREAANDPYVLQRQIYHRFNKQILEENSTRQDVIAVQDSFDRFETHVIEMIQQGLSQFLTTVSQQADTTKAHFTAMVQFSQALDTHFEWDAFVQRNSHVLIDPQAGPRSLATATFPNQNHKSTRPLCQGSLERKSGLLKKWDAAFWVVTPARFMHEFKTEDDLQKDPTPDTSLYLPDCIVGGINGNMFTIKGKDISKGKLGAAVERTKDFEFRAVGTNDAMTWYNVIRQEAGQDGTLTSPTSPTGGLSPTGSLRDKPGEKATYGAAAAPPVPAAAPAAAPAALAAVDPPAQKAQAAPALPTRNAGTLPNLAAASTSQPPRGAGLEVEGSKMPPGTAQ